MKTTLLFSFLFSTVAVLAQNPIIAFYTPNTSGITGGISYSLATSATDLNESVAGANITWNFNQLTSVGSSVTETVVPTSNDAAVYPNANALVHTVSNFNGDEGEGTNNIFLSLTASGASIVGVNIQDVILNYVTNNGFIGAFPLSYNYTNSDPVAGTFQAGEYAGTFQGTLTATVDAYGTLSANLGGFAQNTEVTRLKISQQLTLSFAGFPIGTLTQTTYSYYNSTLLGADPVLRSMTTHVVVQALNINETTSSIEVYEAQLLSNKDAVAAAKPVIAPNPVVNELHFLNGTAITAVTVTDLSGRVVAKAKSGNDINVSYLSAGVYNVAIQLATGSTVQKMVKQ